MSTRSLISIFLSTTYFVLVAGEAFLFSAMHGQYLQQTDEQKSQRIYDSFVAKVQSGQVQPTTEQWLQAIHQEHKVSHSERQIHIQQARLMHKSGWYILLGVFIQTLVLLNIWQKHKSLPPRQVS
jgi:hypothetical protein